MQQLPEPVLALAPWALAFAAFAYFLANAVWLNPLARRRKAWGWLLWLAALALVLGFGWTAEAKLGVFPDVHAAITKPRPEKHWIIALVFALFAVPGAASNLLRQSRALARWATIGGAWLLFAPAGAQGTDAARDVALSFGIVLMLSGALWLWSSIMDIEPISPRRGR